MEFLWKLENNVDIARKCHGSFPEPATIVCQHRKEFANNPQHDIA